jgi:hypothetical protein
MSLPNFLTFHTIPIFLEASGEKATPTFNMVAYTGGKMRVDGFPHPVVVEFSGLDIPSQSIPIRLDHKPYQGVGHTTKISIEKNELVAEGLISRDTNWARDVANSGTKGFPWKASIGGPILEAEFVPHGSIIEVNGQKFEGPLHIVRKMTLKEISFVDNAADTNTSATVNASEKNFNSSMPKVDTSTNTASGSFTDNSTNPTAQATNQTPYQMPTPFVLEDIQKQFRAAALAETNRIEGIRTIAKDEQSELVGKAIVEGWDVNRFELEFLRRSRPIESGVRQEKNRPTHQVLEAVALQSGGMSLRAMEKQYAEPVLEVAEK